jgi:lysophospholipase L1-like esterase
MKIIILSFFLALFCLNIDAQVNIDPCAQLTDIHIVVIGSSTAAGTGPSTPDSAWVNRYRKYLQAINPQNQVTNLAIGGTTTYHIMPTWFVAPAGKPATNPNNNVTQAINLGADAIIVNMPSNDAANGFGLTEQMSNFIAISNSADSLGIPVWVCTTQPKNFGSAASKLIQTSVRDSILSYFGNFSVDFWNGIADANDGILPQYNSGDGTHLSDAGHAVLVQRIINKAIPNLIADTSATSDHVLTNIYLDNTSICGDSTTILHAIVGNIGPSDPNSTSIFFSTIDNNSGLLSTQSLFITSPIPVCSLDTIPLLINAYNGVNYSLQAYLSNSNLNKSNDTSQILQLYTTGHPSITSFNDTICVGDTSILSALGGHPSDTVVWYDAPIGGSIVGFGNNLILNNLNTSQTYYPEVVRGNLHFDESLATSTSTTINWNGVMFDIVALDTITLDSLSTKLNSLGSQTVVAYSRIGSHVGHEMNPGDWTYWGSAGTVVNTAGGFYTLDYPDKILYPNDTLGVYLHLQNGSADLAYLPSGSPLVYSNSKLKVLGGSGVTHTFGAIYTPRNWSGEVFYHHGFNPTGDCNTSRLSAHAVVSTPSLDLGVDTLLYQNQSLLLQGNSFSNYLWSDNSVGNQLFVDSSNSTLGTNLFWLSASNQYGCVVSDTILITFSINTSKHTLQFEELEYSIFPNPSLGKIQLKTPRNKVVEVSLFTASGSLIRQLNVSSNQSIDLSDLAKGVYFISLNQDGKQEIKKLVLY